MKPLPVYEHPAREHERLDREISEALRSLGMTDAVLNAYVYGRFDTSSVWHDQSIATKELISDHLQKELQKVRGAQTA